MATDQESIRQELIRAATKTPVVKEVSNQLFDKVKPAQIFHERSRSVISPQTLSAYTPVKKQKNEMSVAAKASALQF